LNRDLLFFRQACRPATPSPEGSQASEYATDYSLNRIERLKLNHQQRRITMKFRLEKLDAVSGVEPATRAYEARSITRCSPNHRYLHIRQVSCHWTNLRKSPRERLEVWFSRGARVMALWSAWQGSNLRHSVCKTDTRTTELHAV
jgi:hypothetical protein